MDKSSLSENAKITPNNTTMKFELSPKMKPLATVQSSLPHQYKKYELPGSISEYTEGPFGSILWQHMTTEYYTISQQQFFIDRKIRLYPYAPRATVALNCMLRGNLNCILQGAGRVPLIENKYALYYIPAAIKHVAFFSKGYYETIDFELEESYLRFFVKDHPDLSPLYQAMLDGSDTGKQLKFSSINIQIMESITKIRDAKPELPGHRIYVQSRINDIMLQYLQDLQFQSNEDKTIHDRRYALIHEISNYIRVNIGSLPPVATLAELNNIHITTLQKEFKKHTGSTIQDFINNQKMELAIKLLVETNKSIGDIAEMLGYSDSPAFSKAFKARYVLAPGEYRNKCENGTAKD